MLNKKPIGCKYTCNRLASQNFLVGNLFGDFDGRNAYTAPDFVGGKKEPDADKKKNEV